MKMIHPQAMTERQSEALRICSARAERPPSRELMLLSLAAGCEAIEAGVEILSRDLPLTERAKIDLVAADRSGRLIAIDAFEELGLPDLSRCILQRQWLRDQRELLGHLLPRIDPRIDARHWILAAAIRPEAEELLKLLREECFELYRCRRLLLSGEEWLVVTKEDRTPQRLQRVTPQGGRKLSVVNPPAPAPERKSGHPHSARSLLTDKEIGDFLRPDDDGGEEETTASCPL